MLELGMWALAAMSIAFLGWPLLRRMHIPAWLVRARARRRPGIPVTSWLAALLLMGMVWLIGDHRGILGVIGLCIWIGAPMIAGWVTWYWIRKQR
jgi:hypothetical protein